MKDQKTTKQYHYAVTSIWLIKIYIMMLYIGLILYWCIYIKCDELKCKNNFINKNICINIFFSSSHFLYSNSMTWNDNIIFIFCAELWFFCVMGWSFAHARMHTPLTSGLFWSNIESIMQKLIMQITFFKDEFSRLSKCSSATICFLIWCFWILKFTIKSRTS
jgi:hypothetical protein